MVPILPPMFPSRFCIGRVQGFSTHLHDGQQRVEPVQARARGRHRHAHHRQRAQRGHHAGQVRRAARARYDHLHSAARTT